MNLTIRDAPLGISLGSLQTGLQNQEDAGFQLVDLSKGTCAGEEVNLASFEPRTQPVQDLRLVFTPAGLFGPNGNGFSVNSALSARFVQQMADNGLSVVLYCPIVSNQRD